MEECEGLKNDSLKAEKQLLRGKSHSQLLIGGLVTERGGGGAEKGGGETEKGEGELLN